jgi:pRiA4b ORF-3-like protein
MSRHVEACKRRGVGEEHAEGGQKTSVFHVLIEGYFLPMYWLHLDIAAETTLATIDQFLRAIWLECCGHLSAFEIGGVRYTVDEGLVDNPWWGRRQHMRVRLDEVLRVGQTCSYEYDFGSTTELTVKVISQREAGSPRETIRVLARNSPPEPVPCARCGKPALHECSECQKNFCEACAKEHPCGEAMLSPLVNSPREGVCGYTGRNLPYR